MNIEVTMRSAVAIIAFALGFSVVPAAALAQDAPTPPQEEPTVDPNALDLDAGGGFVIIGKEHLPDFTVLIDRENLSKAYDLELNERFLPKIIEAVDKAPF